MLAADANIGRGDVKARKQRGCIRLHDFRAKWAFQIGLDPEPEPIIWKNGQLACESWYSIAVIRVHLHYTLLADNDPFDSVS